MFRKSKKTEPQLPKKSSSQYEKPKVLLIDFSEECFSAVKVAGFNVCSGTFGAPFKVKMGDDYHPVIGEPSLSNYAEQEIIFIDLTPSEMLDQLVGQKTISKGQPDWWASCSLGHIDPRPRFMHCVRKYSDRILTHGGVFVIFAQPPLTQKFFIGKIDKRTGSLDLTNPEIPVTNWSFLSVLDKGILNMEYEPPSKEVNIPNYEEPIYSFLRKHATGINYTVNFDYSDRKQTTTWISILSSKFDKSIGGILSLKDCKGRILILPQISEKAEAIIELLQEVLPDMSPHLFPHITTNLWTHKEEYELDTVLKYNAQQIEVKERAKAELEILDQKIEEERGKLGFLHEILTQDGSKLVENVNLCLECISKYN